MAITVAAIPRAGSTHSRFNVEALERAPPVNCEVDEVIDVDMSVVVVDMLIFIDAELEGGCIVTFMMLVVEELVPE